MKKINNRTLEEQINDRRKHEKANTVFLKLLAKQKSKIRDWGVVRSETYPTKEIKPGVDDV
jgi:hypothetical protein